MKTQDIESDELSTLWTMKQHCDELQDLIERIHQVEDQNNYRSCHPFDSHKMTDLREDSLEEDSQEDSQEEEDTQEEEEYHQEDHQEVVGDHRQCLCCKSIKENW